MPTYFLPARVDITGRGGLVLIAAHIMLLVVCAAVWAAGMGAFIAWSQWISSPRRFLAPHRPPAYRVIPGRPAQAIPAPRPRAIEAPRRRPSARAARPVTIYAKRGEKP